MTTQAHANPIRVLIAEDNFYTRTGTAWFLGNQSAIQIVGEAEDGEQALALYRVHKPDVLILDLRMPKIDGREVAGILCKEFERPRILVLTHQTGEVDVFSALKAGALGYLTKEAPGEQLLAAIAAVSKGQRFYPPEVVARMSAHTSHPQLTNREEEALTLIYQGKANKEIAAAMNIGSRTVAMYVASILAKLGVANRTEAVRCALERGLLKRP